MQRFVAIRYFLLARHLQLWTAIDHAEQMKPKYADNLRTFLVDCKELGLKLSAKYIQEKIIPEFSEGKVPHETAFVALIDTLIERIEDEMELMLFLHIPSGRAEFYVQEIPLFGAEVADSFPSAITDIEESGKCLALGRGTACVFHLMRVMEVGLKSLAKGLRIPYAPSWESYLTQIENRITLKHSSKTRGWKKSEPFYRDTSGDLQMVKIAWRNPTMHVVKTYSPEQAEDVLRAVKAFMQRLATKFNENGPWKGVSLDEE